MGIRYLADSENNQLLKRIGLIFGLAISYAFFAFLGDLITVQASDAAAIWPASGIALAAFLICGNTVWPGVFLGAFIINGWIALDANEGLPAIGLLLIISTGATLQALLGAYLIRKTCSPQLLFQNNQDICRLLCFGAFISCLISPSIGVSTLVYAGFIPAEHYLSNWFIWWLGDAIGVIIFAPLTLIFFAKPRELWRLRINSVAVPLFFVLIVLIAVFAYATEQEQKQHRMQFDSYAANLFNIFQRKLDHHQESLQMLASFYQHSTDVSRQEFRDFSNPVLLQHNEIQALAWVNRVLESEKSIFEQEIKGEGFIDFEIFHQRQSAADGDEKYYSVIRFIEPFKTNAQLLGLNVLAKPGLAESVDNQLQTATMAVTKGVDLIQDKSKIGTMAFFYPVYNRQQSVADDKAAVRPPIGFVMSLISLEQLFKASSSELGDKPVVFSLFDQLEKGSFQLLYSNDSNNINLQNKVNDFRLNYQRVLNIAGRVWQLNFSLLHGLQQKSGSTWLVLSGGLIFTAIFSGFLMVFSGRTFLVKQAVEEKTKDLAQLNYVLTKTNEALATTNKKLTDSEFQFRKLVQTQSAIVWRYDLDDECFTFVSDEAESLLGYPNKKWFEPCFWRDHIHPDDRQAAVDFTLQAVEKYQKFDFEYRMLTSADEVVWIKDIVNVVSTQGKVSELVGVMIDISAEKEAEEQTRLAATTFETQEGITITDPQGVVLKVNHAFTAITGYSQQESVGKHMSFLKSGRQDKAFYTDLWDKLIETGRFEGEIWNRRKNGETFPEWITITAVKDKNGAVTHYVGIFSDITAKKATEEEIKNLAFYDPLTTLPNRRLLLDRVQQEILETKRYGQHGVVIFLDLDRFKILNDSLGHHVGDELLVQVSNRLKSVLREGDTASRLGGDEFVILLPNQGHSVEDATDKAIFVAEKVRVLLNKPYLLNNNEHTFSCSLGIAIFPEDSDEANGILQKADTAMYLSKEKGKNCISFYHPSLQEIADKRLLLENELRLALSHQQLHLYYQPQVNEVGEIISAEALIRWIHPEKGIISPADFIPIAEETSLILPVGNWVLHEACRQIKVLSPLYPNLKHIAINVSPRQFKQKDFVKEIRDAILLHGISAEQLTLELTESIVAEDICDTIEKMKALKELGIKISIDDFGTGYSSLSYLKQMPLDQLKIDQSFVNDINIDHDNKVIVETIINMANNLGLNVIAEGVEEEFQVECLRVKGCLHYQGYYYSRPLDIEAFKDMLAEQAMTDQRSAVNK